MSSPAPVGVIICKSAVANFILDFSSEFDISTIEFMKKEDVYFCFVFDDLDFSFLRFNLVKRHISCECIEAEGALLFYL